MMGEHGPYKLLLRRRGGCWPKRKEGRVWTQRSECPHRQQLKPVVSSRHLQSSQEPDKQGGDTDSV